MRYAPTSSCAATLLVLALGSPTDAGQPSGLVQEGALRLDSRRPTLDAIQIFTGSRDVTIVLGHDGLTSVHGVIGDNSASLARPALLSSIGPCRWLAVSTTSVAGLREDGSIKTVGTVADASGAVQSLVAPTGNFRPESLVAGSNHFLAIGADGSPVGFGASDSGQLSFPTSLTQASQMVARGNWSLAIAADGTVQAWGTDTTGNGPVPADLGACRHLAAGTRHMLAVRQDGSVAGWGSNTQGQLTIPADLGACTQVAAGTEFSAALRSDGTVRTWGKGSHPFAVRENFPDGAALGVCTRISGGGHALAGRGIDGRWNIVGFDTPPQSERIEQWGNLKCVAPAKYFTVGVRDDGSVQAFGLTWMNSSPDSYAPVNVPSDLGPVVSASGGFYHALLLQADGTVRGLGCNRSGESTPPTGLSGVVQVAAGIDASLARLGDGAVRGWGTGWYGADAISLIPSTLPVSAWISAYYTNAGSVSVGGTVSVWGYEKSALAPPANVTGITQLAVGRSHALALRADGSLQAWGRDSYGLGATTVPSDVGPASQIAAGGYHNVVLQQDGQVRSWGRFRAGTSIDTGTGYGDSAVPASVGRARFVAAAPDSFALITQASCPSDLDGSDLIDFGDIGLVLLSFGNCPGCAADLDGSGDVDLGDVAILLLDFGPCT